MVRADKWSAVIAWAIVAIALNASAFAAEPKVERTLVEFFGMMDENKDGRIDQAEFRFRKMEVYYLRDTNRDDRLSKDELPNVSAAAFNAADTKRDGTLSGYEFNQAGFARFEALDHNRDGFITLEEVHAYVRKMK